MWRRLGGCRSSAGAEGLVSILVYVPHSLCGVGGGPILGALAQRVFQCVLRHRPEPIAAPRKGSKRIHRALLCAPGPAQLLAAGQHHSACSLQSLLPHQVNF